MGNTDKICTTINPPLYINKYRTIKPLGSGTYGEVFKVQNVNSEKFYALKKLRGEGSSAKYGLYPNTIREVTLLYQLKNDFIVSLEEVAFDEGDTILLIFELMHCDL